MQICLKNLCKSYNSNKVLHNIDWDIHKGDTWKIEGVSGKGKTTLLYILINLENKDSGSIIFDENIKFSMCFQEDRLLEYLTAVENISLVCDNNISKDEIYRKLEEILPSDALNCKVSELSGGMKRRVAIARAIIAQSDIIIFDEPFSGLDADNIKKTCEFINKYRDNRTLIFVSHEEQNFLKPYKIISV